VLALPVVGALERVRPSEVVSLARTMVGRFGHGGVRTMGSTYPTPSTAPSKFDDHRSDTQGVVPASDPAGVMSDDGRGTDDGGDDDDPDTLHCAGAVRGGAS
jgi:hypothetical protein